MSEQRLAFVHLVEQCRYPVARAAREFGISRKTAHKWLNRFRDQPKAPLVDGSRRPLGSPGKTPDLIEQEILSVHDRHGWGARKVRAVLVNRGVQVPSRTTVHNILRRHDRVGRPPKTDAPPIQHFERSEPNELWQLDYKGPVEVQRHRRHPLAVIDDHSRFLVALQISDEISYRSTWQVLWDAFGEFGLPEVILCDHFFSSGHQPRTLSAFERDLVRLDIRPAHGRPYHPQTQGKVERFNGTLEREFYPRTRLDDIEQFCKDARHWRNTYNHLRPHESLGDLPPVSRWRPSPRSRPRQLPDVEYAQEATVRKVAAGGDIRFRGYQILTGKGLGGHCVRVQEHDEQLEVYYSWKLVRRIHNSQLRKGVLL